MPGLSRIWQFEPTGNSFPCLENKVLRRKKWKPVFIFLVGHFTKADFRETCLFSVWLCFSCCIYKVYLNNNKDKIFLNVRANSTRSVKEKILFVFVSEAHHVDLCWLSWVTWCTWIVDDIPLGDVWEASGRRVLVGLCSDSRFVVTFEIWALL